MAELTVIDLGPVGEWITIGGRTAAVFGKGRVPEQLQCPVQLLEQHVLIDGTEYLVTGVEHHAILCAGCDGPFSVIVENVIKNLINEYDGKQWTETQRWAFWAWWNAATDDQRKRYMVETGQLPPGVLDDPEPSVGLFQQQAGRWEMPEDPMSRRKPWARSDIEGTPVVVHQRDCDKGGRETPCSCTPRGPDITHEIYDEAYRTAGWAGPTQIDEGHVSIGPFTVTEDDIADHPPRAHITADDFYETIRKIETDNFEYTRNGGGAPTKPLPEPEHWTAVPNRADRRKQARKARRKQKR